MAESAWDDSDPSAEPLMGRWRLLRADVALEFPPDVRMEFCRGGRLNYEFSVGGTRHVVPLVYRVDGDRETLRTENPAASHERSTHFHFGAGGVLVIDFAGACAWFVKEL